MIKIVNTYHPYPLQTDKAMNVNVYIFLNTANRPVQVFFLWDFVVKGISCIALAICCPQAEQ